MTSPSEWRPLPPPYDKMYPGVEVSKGARDWRGRLYDPEDEAAEAERDAARAERDEAIEEIGDYSEGCAPPDLPGAVAWLLAEELSARKQRDAAEAERDAARAERDEAREQVKAASGILAEANKIAPGLITTSARIALFGPSEREKLTAERDAAIGALGEPCAECGHIDWRADPNGYLDRMEAAEAERDAAREALQRLEEEARGMLRASAIVDGPDHPFARKVLALTGEALRAERETPRP